MAEEKVGVVEKFFSKPSVAAIELTDGSLKKGDKVHITGHTTDFEQVIESIQIEHETVELADKGSNIGVKVKDRVRPHDIVYLVAE